MRHVSSARRGAGLLALAVALASGAASAEDRECDGRRTAAAPAEAEAQSRSRAGNRGWRIELFGRGGGHALAANTRIEVGIGGFELGPDPVTFADGESGSAWNYLGGAGVRVARGRSGLEFGWTFAPNRLLTPRVAAAGPFGAFDLVEPGGGGERGSRERGPASGASLFVLQAFHEAPLGGGGLSAFVGLGGGFVRVRDEGSDRLLRGGDDALGLFALAQQGLPGDAPPIETDVQVTQERDRALIGGSLGVTFRRGALTIRPRADFFWSASLLSDVVFTISDPYSSMTGSMTIAERIRPAFFLFSVDFGFAARR